jgi:membrane protease YdiL (CAAX protease family)
MYDSQTNRRSGSPTTPKRLLTFIGATFAATWLAYLPLILGHIDLRSPAGILLIIVGGGAPSLTAVVLSAVFQGRDGLKRLWRGGTKWRVPAVWYLVILALPGLASGAAWAVAAAQGAQTTFNPWIPALVSGLLAGLLEESGWTGYAFPLLQSRYGFLPAGVATGVIVALWHVPFFLIPGTTQSASSLPVFVLLVIGIRIVMGWVYNGTGGSILFAVLLHAIGNASAEILNRGPMTTDAPTLTEVFVYSTAAVLAVLSTRRHVALTPSHRLTQFPMHHAREDSNPR